MKNIFEHHVREVHLTEDRKLRLRVANINQAIEALELINQGLNQVGPKCPELELDLAAQPAGTESRNCEKTVSKITISFVEKQKASHRDVYIIRVFPNIRHNTTVIINEDNVDAVKARLVKLVGRFNQEIKKDQALFTCGKTNQMIGRIRPVHTVKLIGEPIENRDGSFTVTEAFKSHLMMLDKMGSEQISRQSEPGCEPKQRDIFNERKEDE